MVGKVEEEKMMKCNTFCTGQPCKNILCVYSLTLASIFTPALFYFYFFKLQTPKNLKCYVLKYSVEAKMFS